jgi:hypothetical protein
MRALLAIVAVAGCSNGSSGPGCDLETVMARDFIGAENCGEVLLDDGTGQMAARVCVRNAVDASRPFRAMFELQGIDSHAVRGYAGDGTALYEYAYDSYTFEKSQRWKCEMLIDVGPCDGQMLANNLCLMCTLAMLDEASRCEER